VATALASGRPILALDAVPKDAAREQKAQYDPYFLSYNRSDHSERLQGILTAAAYLEQTAGRKLEIIGLGDAGVWCIFAAAVAPTAIEVVADLNGFGGSDQDFRERFFVPGIQRAGGLNAALGLLSHIRTIVPGLTARR
jgi:hypothetical protein